MLLPKELPTRTRRFVNSMPGRVGYFIIVSLIFSRPLIETPQPGVIMMYKLILSWWMIRTGIMVIEWCVFIPISDALDSVTDSSCQNPSEDGRLAFATKDDEGEEGGSEADDDESWDFTVRDLILMQGTES